MIKTQVLSAGAAGRAGDVVRYSYEVVNEGNMPHDFVVERDGADVAATEVLQPGQSTTLTVALEEGDYVFYCSVGAHRAAGMETPVTVSA